MRNKKIYFFIGTTAEFIKLAPIIREFKQRKISFKLITSGQTKVLFEDLSGYVGKIKPDIVFKEKAQKSSPFLFGVWAMRTFITAIFSLRKEFKGLNKNNSYFIIHGDTVSSLIGTVIAKIYGLRVVHIESGLRSFNFLEPFPEEICRFIIIHLADILFAPTEWALNNLRNLSGKKIQTGENTLIETYQWAINQKWNRSIAGDLGKYYILTMHRQEHIFFKRRWTIKTLKYVLKNAGKKFGCVLVMHHLSENFLASFNPHKIAKGKVLILPRIPYVDFINLMKNAEVIATDGCTNQEEAYYIGLPLLALRNRTERIEGLGENVILSRDKTRVIKNFFKNYKAYRRKSAKLSKRPSFIIVNYLLDN